MTFQYRDGFLDQSNRLSSSQRVDSDQKISQPLKIDKRLLGIDQLDRKSVV